MKITVINGLLGIPLLVITLMDLLDKTLNGPQDTKTCYHILIALKISGLVTSPQEPITRAMCEQDLILLILPTRCMPNGSSTKISVTMK